jgi:hypothetical protein
MRSLTVPLALAGLLTLGHLLLSAGSRNPRHDGPVGSTHDLRGQMPPSFDQDVAIEARSCELKDGGFSAEFSVEEHAASGVTETQFYLPETELLSLGLEPLRLDAPRQLPGSLDKPQHLGSCISRQQGSTTD